MNAIAFHRQLLNYGLSTGSKSIKLVLMWAADGKLPMITRYLSEGLAKWSLAYVSGWDIAICRSINGTVAQRLEQGT